MKKIYCKIISVFLISSISIFPKVYAHHGLANFDLNTEIELTGSVAKIRLINPHSWLSLDVVDEKGEIVTWQCELRGSTVLRRSGWTADMFVKGSTVTITAAPDRFAPSTCYLTSITFENGMHIDRYGQVQQQISKEPVQREYRLPDGTPNIDGEWASEQRMLTDPMGASGAFVMMSVAQSLEPGTMPAGAQAYPGTRGTAISLAENPIDAFWSGRSSGMTLTAQGEAAIKGFDGATTDNPRLRCEPTNIIFDWTFEAEINRITQAENKITLLYGSMGLERIIHLDQQTHPVDLTASLTGHSIGRWENDVLIVDTIGFLSGILNADVRLPSSEAMHVIERFELDPESFALTRTYTVDDSLYFEGQFKGSDIVYVADIPYQNSVCEDLSYKKQKTEEVSWWRFWD